MMALRRTWIALALLASLAACGQEARAYDGPQDVVDALADSEIVCEGLEVEKGTAIGETGHDPLIEQRGVCAVDDAEVTISTFANEGDREDWLAVGRLLGPTAYGPNWAISGASDEVVDEIAEVLNASTEEV